MQFNLFSIVDATFASQSCHLLVLCITYSVRMLYIAHLSGVFVMPRMRLYLSALKEQAR